MTVSYEPNDRPCCYRTNIQKGLLVDVVLKKDQRTGKRTRGKVHRLLTSKPYHSRGIKVQLDSYKIGRVQEIIDPVLLPPPVGT